MFPNDLESGSKTTSKRFFHSIYKNIHKMGGDKNDIVHLIGHILNCHTTPRILLKISMN